MKVLVIGGGGREHALVWKLKQSPRVDKIWCVPGNGGIDSEVECCRPIQQTWRNWWRWPNGLVRISLLLGQNCAGERNRRRVSRAQLAIVAPSNKPRS